MVFRNLCTVVMMSFALMGSGVGSTLGADSKPARPNILFIIVDDLRPELGCYGKSHIKSPNIDKLASAGVLFKRAYCQQALCSPSRTSMLTGLRPDSVKVWDLDTHFRKTVPDVVTLPQHLMAHGYYAAGMGKVFHARLDDEKSWSRASAAPKGASYVLPASLQLLEERRKAAEAKGLTGVALSRQIGGPAVESADVADDAYRDGHLATMAIEALREFKGKHQPFFLAVGFVKPHLPFAAPKKYWDQYDRARLPLPATTSPARGAPTFANVQAIELSAYAGIPARLPMDNATTRELLHGYAACVSYMDAQVGRVIDELDRLALRENTIIVLLGDHGWKLGENGMWSKFTTSEFDTNAPLIVSAPGVKSKGKTTAALVEFVDLYPTLCDLAGVPAPGHLEGDSFRLVLESPDRAWKAAVFSQHPRQDGARSLMAYSMRTDRFRYTRWVDRAKPGTIALELYDHQTDPGESVNQAENEKYSTVLRALGQRFDKGWRDVRPQ